MRNLYIILLVVFYVINSKVYLAIFDKSLKRKYDKKWFYVILWLGTSGIIITKQFAKLLFHRNTLLFIMATITLLFLAFIVFFFFVGSVKKKIILLGAFYIFFAFVDAIAIGVCTIIFHVSVVSLSEIGLGNVVASGIESFFTVLMLALCTYIGFKYKDTTNVFYDYNEVFILAILVLIIAIPSIIIFNNITVLGNNLSIIVILQFGIIAFVVLICSIMIYRKNINVYKTNFQNWELKKELEYYNSMEQASEALKKLRHDTGNHYSSLYSILSLNMVEDAKEYLKSIIGEINIANEICIINDRLLSAIITEKVQKARIKGIDFAKVILTSKDFDEFMMKMKDIDKTAIFSNLLDNAIEAAEQAEKKKIEFELRQGFGCVNILCKNSFKQLNQDKNGKITTTKKDKNIHGLGLGIITDTVHKYGGTIVQNNTEDKFCTRITIFY